MSSPPTKKARLSEDAAARDAAKAVAAAAAAEEAIQRQEFLAELFVKSITEKEYEDIPDSYPGANMKVLRNIVDLETEERLDIVIRKITAPFWQACIAKVNKSGERNRVCVVGTPGIGKTTSTSVLIRILLNDKRTVVYRILQEDTDDVGYYEFIPHPKNGSVTTRVYQEMTPKSQIPSLLYPSTYYVVDPGNTKRNCNPRSGFQPKVIIVASPDERHWNESEYGKVRGSVDGYFMFFPLWTLDELLNARSVLGRKHTQAAIQEILMEEILRAPQGEDPDGGDPSRGDPEGGGHVRGDPEGRDPREGIPIAEITVEEVKRRHRIVGGVPRYVFAKNSAFAKAQKFQDEAIAVLTKEQAQRIAAGTIMALNSMNESQPKSAIMGYLSSEKDLFDKASVVVISVEIAEKIRTKFMTYLWQMMKCADEGGWKIFEFYTRALMTKKEAGEYLCWEIGKKETSERNLILGGCKDIRQLPDIVKAATKTKNVLFHSTQPWQKLIDFLYQDDNGQFHAFQATVAKEHTANPTTIMALEAAVGGANRLSIYYLVPSEHFKQFKTKPVDPKSQEKGPQCDLWKVKIPSPNGTVMIEKNIFGDTEE